MLSARPLAWMAILGFVASAAVVSKSPPPSAELELDRRNPSLHLPSIILHQRHGDDEDDNYDPQQDAHPHETHAQAAPSAASDSSGHDHLILEPIPPPLAHDHHHGASAPLSVLNETEILLHHQPNPLSYWTHDYVFDPTDDRLGGRGQWGGWILWGHAVGMTIALLLIFPLAHALRDTPFATPLILIISGLVLIGLLSSTVYNARTPDLYVHNSHGPVGWVLVSLFFAIAGWDVWRAIRGVKEGGWRARCWRLLGVDANEGGRRPGYGRLEPDEQTGLQAISEIDEDDNFGTKGTNDEDEVVVLFSASSPEGQRRREARARVDGAKVGSTRFDDELSPRSSSSSSTLRHQHTAVTSFDVDVQHPFYDGPVERLTIAQRFLKVALTVAWSVMPVLGVAAFLSGLTVYAGSCRAEYISGCLAHLIKGSIFIFFGLATFARYIGVWAHLGWSWNNRPSARVRRCLGGGEGKEIGRRTSGQGRSRQPDLFKQRRRWEASTAEWTESCIIFVYGLTNTWMERFGAETGSPLTIHQVQHISIALMFFFGGAMGLALESKVARDLLASTGVGRDRRRLRDIEKPPTWSGSFNPFPALVIGITGLVMSSHHQKYKFAIEIHSLWGNLLALFGVFRIMTYVFLWLRPPRSILPSRPPSELVAAFCVTGGGIAFLLSTEQVVYGAMRSGWDDLMSFLTFTVSLTYFLFGWLFLVLVARGWADRRNVPRTGRDSDSSISNGSGTSSPLRDEGASV